VIAVPQTPEEVRKCAEFMYVRCKLMPTPATRYMIWKNKDGVMLWCIAMQDWVGKMATVHMAALGEGMYLPKKLFQGVFDYLFNYAGRELVIGLVNSNDDHVLRFDLWMGFKQLLSLPGVHEDEGDMVVLGMWKHECRWIKGLEDGREKLSTAAA
jgi:hypothetical protein